MTAKRQRLWFVLFTSLCLCAGTLLALQALRDNVVFFYTPSELFQKNPPPGTVLRLGGLVKTGSVTRQGDEVRFVVMDGEAELPVAYRGVLPSLFREGQGVVAQGKYAGAELFAATQVLAKHDEYYMPKEVADKLKASGHWHAP